MGLLTADVTPLGVVLTGDSQPVELRESSYSVLPFHGQRKRPCLVPHRGAGFTAVIGFVGTERIAKYDTLTWLSRFSAANRALSVDAFCTELAAALTDEWSRHGYDTCLWLFICGAAEGRPMFRAVRNCGPDMDHNLLYTDIGSTFVWHNDLENHVATYGKPGESEFDTLMHTMALYRNGVLLPAVAILDDFRDMLNRLFSGGFDGFTPVGTLGAYTSIVKMRAEFVKRLFDRDKGIYAAEARPIGGTVYAWRVDLDGAIFDHTGKKPVQVARVT